MSFSVSFAKPRDTLEAARARKLQTVRIFRTSSRPGQAVATTSMPLRLVLIEDHQALREGLELLLDRAGIEVLGTAGTADEGRALIEQHDPDVALIDIRLGEDSGIDLTAR